MTTVPSGASPAKPSAYPASATMVLKPVPSVLIEYTLPAPEPSIRV